MDKGALKILTISYISAVAIILILLFSAQALIQFALSQQQHVSYVASQINQQELRTERMFRNVIQLQNPAPGVDYKKITTAIENDDLAWEKTQGAMYGDDTGIDIHPQDFGNTATANLQHVQSYYNTMVAALHRIFLQEDANKATPDSVRPDAGIFFYAEPVYLQALVTVYGDFSDQADGQIVSVRIIEAILCCLTFLVLCAEFLLVIRPATNYLRDHTTH